MTRDDGERDDEARRFAHDLLQSVAVLQALLGALRATDGDAGHAALHDRLQREVDFVGKVCQSQLDGLAEVQPVAIDEVAAEVVERTQVTYSGDISLEATAVRLEADPVEWHRCLYNVIENACRAAQADGKVEVRVVVDDGTLRVSVDDSGPGFGNAAAGRASLGLVTVNRVIEGHGGHVELAESHLGGAQLTVVVPLPA
jgi:signal transduction histidine kinase